MRVLIRYSENDEFKTCVKESKTMNEAEEMLLREREGISILSSSIIENGTEGILSGKYMLCNSR